MPSSAKKKVKDLHLASNLEELNKIADPGLPVDRNANPTPYIKSADKVYLKAQDNDLDGDEEYAYVYYMRYFNIISLIKKSVKYSGNKKYFDNLLGKNKIIKSIERAEALQGSLRKRYEKLKTQQDAEAKAQEEAKQKEEEDKKKLAALKARNDSDSGFESDVDSRLNGNGISSSSEVYNKLKVSHNSILTPEMSENDSGALISGLESSASSFVTDGVKCISAQELYNLIKVSEFKILILDCRPHAKFTENWIQCSCCINIPAELLDQGVSVGSIERRLPELTRKAWNRRGEKEFVILMDESTKVSEITPECRIQRLKDVIFTYDSYSSLKHEPVFLDGGFHSWLWHYPSLAMKPELPMVRSQPKSVTPVDLSSLDYPELPEDKILIPQSTVTKPTSSPLLYPCIPNADLQNMLGPKDSTEQNKASSPAQAEFSSNVPSPGQPGIIPSGAAWNHGPGAKFRQLGIHPAVPPSQPPSDNGLPRSADAGSLQHEAPKREPMNLPPTQPVSSSEGLPLPSVGPQSSVGIDPQAVNPSSADLRATGPVPKMMVPHSSSQPIFQPNVPPTAPKTVPSTQPSSQSSVAVAKPFPQPSVPFTGSSNTPTAQPGTPPKQPSNLKSNLQPSTSIPGTQPSNVNSIPSPVTPSTSVQVTPVISTLPSPQVSGVVSPPHPNNVSQQVTQRVEPQNQPSVSPLVSQVPHISHASISTSQSHQVNSTSIPGADARNINSTAVKPSAAAQSGNPQHSPQGPTQNKTSRPYTTVGKDSASSAPPNISDSSQQPDSRPSNFFTSPGLPHGWEKVSDGNRTYYKDHNTLTTHWNPPTTGKGDVTLQSGAQRQQQQPPVKRQSSVERPKLHRSNSSPNLAKIKDQGPSGPKKPIIDRLSKPESGQKGQTRPVVNRVAKPLSANQLDSFNPSYGGPGIGLTGLRNLGNTCYMNSVVQCLSSVAPLATYFMSGVFREDINRSNRDGTRGELAESFSVLIRVLHSGQYKCVSAGEFKRTVGKFKSQFSGYDQHDSQELLAFLMDGLQEDLNKVKVKPYLKAPGDDLDPQTAADMAWENHKKRNESIMVELFDGLFMSTVQCMVCSKESRTFDSFSNLTLPLPPHKSQCTLEDCLKLFTKPEKMAGDDKWFCPKCRQRREASKRIQIWKLPRILVVHLKRFQYEGMWRQKLQTAVNFHMDQVDMSAFVVGPKSATRCYNLHAVSNHYGTMHGGHYTAFAKNVYDKKWYKFDDQYVTDMSPRDVVTSAGYLLFYTSIDFPPPTFNFKS